MLREQLDSLPESTLFICTRCRTLYWNLLSRGELFIKKNGVVKCQYCKRTNISYYDSKEKLIEEMNQTISALERTKRKGYEKDIADLKYLKNSLMQRTFNGELVK
jgi:DNA-directed RNA polymerase subunit RPC12/RpoP